MAESNDFTIHALELGPMENFVYLLHDHSSDTAAIVDPAWDVEEVLSLADEKGIRITDILLTHSHHDHVNGIEKVLSRTDAQIHLLKAEARFWEKPWSSPICTMVVTVSGLAKQRSKYCIHPVTHLVQPAIMLAKS